MKEKYTYNRNNDLKIYQGPRSRFAEFTFALSVFFQFIKGFRSLHFEGPCISIFGSARFKKTMNTTNNRAKWVPVWRKPALMW